MSMYDKKTKPVKVTKVNHEEEKKKVKVKSKIQISQSPNLENRPWYDH